MNGRRVAGRFWRMLAPRWSHRPLSGEGAARQGGRFNQPGRAALYMSEAFVTAISEYEQDLGIRPGTLCAYDVDTSPVADLCDPTICQGLGVDPGTLTCPWKHIALIEKARPPTWDLSERLAGQGFAGLLAPSIRDPLGTNLVLWRWNDAASRMVTALDPLGDLPVDQASWPSA